MDYHRTSIIYLLVLALIWHVSSNIWQPSADFDFIHTLVDHNIANVSLLSRTKKIVFSPMSFISPQTPLVVDKHMSPITKDHHPPLGDTWRVNICTVLMRLLLIQHFYHWFLRYIFKVRYASEIYFNMESCDWSCCHRVRSSIQVSVLPEARVFHDCWIHFLPRGSDVLLVLVDWVRRI